jgi:hypothetical protein
MSTVLAAVFAAIHLAKLVVPATARAAGACQVSA